MAQVNIIGPYLSAFLTTDGTEVKPDGSGWVSLTSGSTYVFAVRVSDQPLESLNIITDGTIAWTGGATIEDTNAPRDSGQPGTLPGSCTDWDVSADTTWVQENPSTATVGSSGTGWTITALSLVKTAGKGAAMIHLGNCGSARVRLKVTPTTSGTMRVAPFGKS